MGRHQNFFRAEVVNRPAERARTALVVDRDECEGRFGDFEAVVAVAAAAPRLDADAQGGSPDPDDIGVEADFVADEDGGMEDHAVGGDGGATAPRPAGGGVAGGQIHLSHQPAAEDIAGRIGVGRHGDGADDRLSDRDGIGLRHSQSLLLASPGSVTRVLHE